MCGRFSLTTDPATLMKRFLLDELLMELSPRYNIAPGQLVPAIVSDGTKRRMGWLRWGLVPSWARDETSGFKLINARAETLTEKPMFRSLFARKRCLIPADGFYEWKKTGQGKQPMRITLKSGEPFAFAGLYDTWTAPDGRRVSTCTIITTAPNELIQRIHNRMPVMLRREDEELWLDRKRYEPELLRSLLVPYDAAAMRMYPVSPLVGNPNYDTPACIEEIPHP